jgi:hypothetical protein
MPGISHKGEQMTNHSLEAVEQVFSVLRLVSAHEREAYRLDFSAPPEEQERDAIILTRLSNSSTPLVTQNQITAH